MDVVIVNYGMGNLYSIQSALKYLGVSAIISSNSQEILNAQRVILPGVGAFRNAMMNLRERNFEKTIMTVALEKKTPILGICLGMQLLGRSSTEDGFSEGLGLFDCPVERFQVKDNNIKVPHVGFNTTIVDNSKTKLFRNLPEKVDFYYTHSYRMASSFKIPGSSGECYHGDNFIASFEKDNICGTQFHPEKSQSNGLVVLKNFIEWVKNG